MNAVKMPKKDLSLRWLAVILFLLFIGECKSTKRIQRRFMWKHVDNTMDGIFDSMASSARAMKSMIGDLIPGMATAPTHSVLHSHKMMDFLPSETTKIKYIIHTPPTKPMKILKMAVPKKVVKLMTITKPIVEVKQINKQKINFANAAALRQMEKEQELIAEGRKLIKSIKENENHKKDNDIIKGKIKEFETDWQPISSTQSYPISHLHTNVLSEPLPKAEKQIYIPENDIPHDYEESRHKNTYEVTEYATEESVAVPYTQHFQNSRGFVPIRPSHVSNIHQTARSGLSSTVTTTTEAPNYPSSFLKKHRERPTQMPRKLKTKTEISWVRPSNATLLETKTKPPQIISYKLKGIDWSVMGPTILPAALELSTHAKLRKYEPSIQPTADERLRPKSTMKPTTPRPRDIRQRGSIKFGDKLTEFYK